MIDPELFGGGDAQLTLTRPDNPLETSVDIYVEPPRKRRQQQQQLQSSAYTGTA